MTTFLSKVCLMTCISSFLCFNLKKVRVLEFFSLCNIFFKAFNFLNLFGSFTCCNFIHFLFRNVFCNILIQIFFNPESYSPQTECLALYLSLFQKNYWCRKYCIFLILLPVTKKHFLDHFLIAAYYYETEHPTLSSIYKCNKKSYLRRCILSNKIVCFPLFTIWVIYSFRV